VCGRKLLKVSKEERFFNVLKENTKRRKTKKKNLFRNLFRIFLNAKEQVNMGTLNVIIIINDFRRRFSLHSVYKQQHHRKHV